MRPWQCYLDESYNNAVFCVGGFLGPAELWDHVTARWRERLDYENRWSAKRTFPAISRYHATDCASLKREFSEKSGWTIPRQIRLAKRLCEIIGNAGPIGIVIGGRIDDIKTFLRPGDTAKDILYDLCFRMTLMNSAAVINEYYPGNRIKVFYDQGKTFESNARQAFNTFVDGSTSGTIADCFIDAEPQDSRTCIPLQAADFIAYEGLRRTDGVRKGNDNIRKSLNALLGSKVPLLIDQFTTANFMDLGRMIDNRQLGRPVYEGVGSKLARMLKEPGR